MYLAPNSEKQTIRDNPGMMLKIMTERTPIRAYVGSDFGPDIPNSSRFFAGPLNGE
jgi:hypothetical protein